MSWLKELSPAQQPASQNVIPSPALTPKSWSLTPCFFASLVSLQSLNHVHLSLPHLEGYYYLAEVNAAEYSARQQAGQDRWLLPGLFLYRLVQGALSTILPPLLSISAAPSLQPRWGNWLWKVSLRSHLATAYEHLLHSQSNKLAYVTTAMLTHVFQTTSQTLKDHLHPKEHAHIHSLKHARTYLILGCSIMLSQYSRNKPRQYHWTSKLRLIFTQWTAWTSFFFFFSICSTTVIHTEDNILRHGKDN